MRPGFLVKALCWSLVALGWAGSARAAYLESDSGPAPEPRRDPPPRVLPPPPPPPPKYDHPVRDLVRSVDVGSPYRYRGLTMFPLVLRVRPAGDDIRTLDEAMSRGWVVVRERDDAQVSEILVRNDSGRAVFLLGGEIIAGGKQTRFVRDDVLLSAESGWVAVPVYCGEKERWSQVHEEFRSPSAVVDQRLRKMAAGAESQGRIWGEIEGQLSGAGVSAPTRRYDEIYRDRSVNRQLDECVERFRPLPRRQSVGVVVASGGRIVGCDVFSDPDLFSRLWDKICRSYAMEVVHEGRSWSDEKWTGPGERDARTFVDRMLSASISERSTPGAGRGVRLSGSVEGGGLVWRDRCVHVAAFSSVSWLRREDR